MKSILYCLLAISLCCSCSSDKGSIVQDFIAANSKCDLQQLASLTSEDFRISVGDTTMNKDQFLAYTKNSQASPSLYQVLEMNIQDSVIKTKERIVSIFDTLLNIEPKAHQLVTYLVRNAKVYQIRIDSLLNGVEYQSAYEDKIAPFALWVEAINQGKQVSELAANVKPLLEEYLKLSPKERKDYEIAAQLKGTYISYDNQFYRKLIFKGRSTVVVVDAWIGYEFATSYEIDENYIRIRTDKSDLLLRIKDKKTLLGEGFAEGTFKKK